MCTKPGSLASLAAQQHGVVSRRQLLDSGFRPDAIKRMIRKGHLHPIHRGVYAVGHTRIAQEGRWLAAVLACGPGAFLSHGPAGQLLGILERRHRYALHVSLAAGGNRSPSGILTHRPRSLEPRDTMARYGVPVTTATRAVWDLAADFTAVQTRPAFEQAEKLRLLDRGRLAALLAAAPNRKGAGAIRTLLGERVLPLAETRSKLEELLLITCRDHSLPLPAVNVPLLGYEADFLWPEAMFVVEADGGDHLNRAQRDRDNARDAALARAGYLVRRYSWTALAERAGVAREVLEILAERLR
jgi:very-short-patch-repair endonuclease